MILYGIGTDIVSVDRIKKSLKDKNFLNRLYTKEEISKCSKLINPSSNEKPIKRYPFNNGIIINNGTCSKHKIKIIKLLLNFSPIIPPINCPGIPASNTKLVA